MKILKISLITLCTLIASTSKAQEPVYSFARVASSVEWNKSQRDLWMNEIKKDKGNAAAWYYVYRAQRNLNACDTSDSRSYEEKQEWMRKWVEDMGKAVPNSYEYNLTACAQQGIAGNYKPYFKKAEALSPDRPEHLDFGMLQGELERNIETRNRYAQKLYRSGFFSAGFINYCYNLIIGLKPNAVIFTAGDNDTYGIWLVQSMGIREDVTVINMSLIEVKSYEKLICKELGCDTVDPSKYVGRPFDGIGYQKARIIAFANNKKKYPVYVSVTAWSAYTKALGDKLYLCGLAYEYSESNIETISLIQNNVENRYRLDYIVNPFYKDDSQPLVDRLNQNYIVPLYTLWKHYKTAGETGKMNRIRPVLEFLLKHRPDQMEILKEIRE